MLDCIHFYKVDSLENTRIFYGDKLNLNLYKDQGKCLIYDTGHGKIGFCNHFPNSNMQSNCITFVFKDHVEVDYWYKKLVKMGLEIESPLTNEIFNIYHFFTVDPNNIKLEFQCFL